IADIMASISLIEEDIQKKKEQIAQSEKDLEAAREDEQNQYNAMIVRIRFMYEKGDMNYINLLMEGGSMEDLVNKADYIEKIYDYDRQLLIRYQETRQKIEDLKAQLEDEESELEMTQDEYKEEQEGMEAAMAELKAVSDDYALQISKAKQQAEVYKTQIKQQNAQIAKLEEEARKKAEEEARRKAAQNKNNTSTTTTSKPKGTATVNSAEILAANGSDIGKQIAIYACGFVGNPYVPGGTSLTNGADCSGFTQSVFKAYGYSIPRSSYSQRTAGKEVSFAEAQPGDIICYAGHVALYIGNGKIVHASGVKTGIKIGYATYREIL
ncbi:MAG: NlpC/P60 family protein, partial [Lachnospiraceae bacterium]